MSEANQQTERPGVSTMNHCGMVFAYHHPEVSGILLGTSRPQQLADSINFFRAMQRYDYSDFYEQLKRVYAQQHG